MAPEAVGSNPIIHPILLLRGLYAGKTQTGDGWHCLTVACFHVLGRIRLPWGHSEACGVVLLPDSTRGALRQIYPAVAG